MYKGEKTVTIFLKDKNFFFVHGVKCILTEFLSKEGMHVVFEDTLDNIKKCQVAIIGMSFFLNYKLGMVSDYNLPTIFWMETADEKSIGYVRGYTLSFQVPVNDFLSQVKNINANKNPGSKKELKTKENLLKLKAKLCVIMWKV
ncbi:hypothetical protein ACQ86O_05020 [Serratia sp. L9]|uniref:hypothetical protein n=1 Tax=Serratia sp. L9 TaxID=3423946 RepID=UPI003D668ED1